MLIRAVQDLYSAGMVVILTLWNFEALFALCNCVGATCLYIWSDVEGFGMVRKHSHSQPHSTLVTTPRGSAHATHVHGSQVTHLSWKFVSIMIVFPLTYEVPQLLRTRAIYSPSCRSPLPSAAASRGSDCSPTYAPILHRSQLLT